ncbi:MAG: NAD(P)/FAD-dependent oxidoreductase [Thermodesulfobacteriota bacterium]
MAAGDQSVIIIGAGLAGLSAGIFAQKNGYKAHIFEHAAQPGGVSATWQRQGFTIDGGAHFYMGWRPGKSIHGLYRELGVWQADKFQELDLYARFQDSASGRQVTVTKDLDRLAADLKALSPADAGFIDDLLTGARVFRDLDLSASLARPAEMIGTLDNLKMMITGRKALKYWFGRYAQPMERAVRGLASPFLCEVLQNLFLPSAPVVFVQMILGMLAGGNLALRLDGSAGFARALEDSFTGLGGRVTYQATVEEILVENGRAAGVRLEDGKEHRAGRVISAGDGHSTLYKLLGGRYVGPRHREAHEKWPLFKPILMVNYGVAREFREEPWLAIFKPTRPITAGHWDSAWCSVRLFNYLPGHAPAGRTVVQVMADTAWRPWRDLRDDLKAYKAEKALVAEQVLGALEELWPGIGGLVEMTDVATPYTYWRYTFNRDGAFEGFAVTAQSLRAALPRTLPGLKDFYMAGQWTIPGGGVVPSLYTGRHAVMLMCRDDGRTFSAPAD